MVSGSCFRWNKADRK